MRFQAWVRVHLDEAQVHVVVYHEVEAEPFKAIVVRPYFADESLACGLENVGDSGLNLRLNLRVETDLLFLEQELVEVRVADLVARLELAVVL